jgi:hypothetical protein
MIVVIFITLLRVFSVSAALYMSWIVCWLHVLQWTAKPPTNATQYYEKATRFVITSAFSTVSVQLHTKPQEKTLVLNNWQIRLLVFSSITSRHVSAYTCGHLQVISVISIFNILCHRNHLKMDTCRGRNTSWYDQREHLINTFVSCCKRGFFLAVW